MAAKTTVKTTHPATDEPGARAAQSPRVLAVVESSDGEITDDAQPGDDVDVVVDAILLSETIDPAGIVLLYDEALGDDEDTSLCTSLRLHLMSEHHMPEALHMGDEEAEAAHQLLHGVRQHAHPEHDLRFRAGRALAGLFLLEHPPVEDMPVLVCDLPAQVARA